MEMNPVSVHTSIPNTHPIVTFNPSPLDKMSAISLTFSNAFSSMNIFCILIRISLKFVRKGPNDNTWVLVQVMAWRPTGDKPLSEPMLTLFIDGEVGSKSHEYTYNWKYLYFPNSNHDTIVCNISLSHSFTYYTEIQMLLTKSLAVYLYSQLHTNTAVDKCRFQHERSRNNSITSDDDILPWHLFEWQYVWLCAVWSPNLRKTSFWMFWTRIHI